MKPIALALVLACGLPAQGGRSPVIVYSCLDDHATRRSSSLLAAAVPDSESGGIDIVRAGDNDLFDIVAEERAPVDIVLGLDALYAAELGRRGRLASYDSPAAVGLSVGHRGVDNYYAVPLLSPYAIAFDQRVWNREEAPVEIEELLFDGRFSDEVALATPEVMPGLWVSWIRGQLRLGYSEERAFAWLRTLDAHTVSYEDSVAGVIEALVAQRASVAVLSAADIVLAGSRDVGLAIPASKMACKGLAVGIVVTRDSVPVRRVADVLCSREFAVAMVDSNLVPSPRTGLSDGARGWMAAATLPYDGGGSADMERWFAEWQASVRGRGQSYESLDFALEVIFAALFAVFVYCVYRHMQSSERKQTP